MTHDERLQRLHACLGWGAVELTRLAGQGDPAAFELFLADWERTLRRACALADERSADQASPRDVRRTVATIRALLRPILNGGAC